MTQYSVLRTQDTSVILLPWLGALVGADEHRRATLAVPFVEGDTVRAVLERLSATYPALDRELWDHQHRAIGQIVEVVVNGAVLDLHQTLDSALQPGAEILLVPQYQGG